MDLFKMEKPENAALSAGKLLIAEPFLGDQNFARTVILLCEHGEGGSVGFVLNKATELTLGDVLPELYTSLFEIYQGGPVQLDTLHMLHRRPQLFGGIEVSKSVFWGGSYDALQNAIMDNSCESTDLRLFVGYSGWSSGQLEKELKEGSWIVTEPTESLLFDTKPEDIWETAIRSLGQQYAYLAQLPVNPQLN